jgi:chromosome partitioning protein
MGLRVLVIDADHQCTASELLLGESRLLKQEQSKTTLHDLLREMLDDDFRSEQFNAYVQQGVSNIGKGIEELSVLPCSVRIDDFQTNIAKAKRGYQTIEEFQRTLNKRRLQLKRWIEERYDFTLIDCPPSIPIQVKFLLSIADSYIVPCVPDRLSVRGCIHLLDRVKKLGYKVQPLGTLWSLYRQQNIVHRTIVEKTIKRMKPYDLIPNPFKTIIPNASAIAEATEADQKPMSFKAKYKPQFAQLYESLCNEIVKRTQWNSDEAVVRSASNGKRARV